MTRSFPKMPRMADFASFGEAVGLTLGWPAGTLLADYNANRREASAAQLEDSLVAEVLLRNAHSFYHWTGTSAELLALLARGVSKKDASSSRWPKAPGWFTNELRRIAPQLRMQGISVTFERSREQRLIVIRKT